MWCLEMSISSVPSSEETEKIETENKSKIPQWDGLKEVNKIVIDASTKVM